MADIDGQTAVDMNGTTLAIGNRVAISGGIIVGLKSDPNNNQNVWVLPDSRARVNLDPDHIANGVDDGACILVSGYNVELRDDIPGPEPPPIHPPLT